MKKTYIMPIISVELFETADVITESYVVFNAEQTDAKNAPEVDLNEKFSQQG